MFDEKTGKSIVAVLDRQIQRGRPVHEGIHFRAVGDEQLGNFPVPLQSCIQQRCAAILCIRIHVRALGDEKFGEVPVPAPRHVMQWRPPVPVLHIHFRAIGDQQLDNFPVALGR